MMLVEQQQQKISWLSPFADVTTTHHMSLNLMPMCHVCAVLFIKHFCFVHVGQVRKVVINLSQPLQTTESNVICDVKVNNFSTCNNRSISWMSIKWLWILNSIGIAHRKRNAYHFRMRHTHKMQDDHFYFAGSPHHIRNHIY